MTNRKTICRPIIAWRPETFVTDKYEDNDKRQCNICRWQLCYKQKDNISAYDSLEAGNICDWQIWRQWQTTNAIFADDNFVTNKKTISALDSLEAGNFCDWLPCPETSTLTSVTDNCDDQLDGNISIYSNEIILLASSLHGICVMDISPPTLAFVEWTL